MVTRQDETRKAQKTRVVGFVAILVFALPLTACGGAVDSGSSGGRSSEEESSTNPSSGDGARNAAERTDGTTDDQAARPDENPQASADATRCYVDAVNAEDLDGLTSCFAPDGTVVDVSRRIEGQYAIRRWAGNEVIGGTLEVIESEPRPNGARLLVHWAPAGSSGWRAYYTFETTPGGQIVVADLQYA